MEDYTQDHVPSKAPWLITLLVMAGAGVGGYYLFDKSEKSDQALEESRKELAALAAKARADLVATEAAAALEKARLQKKEEEAKKMANQLKAALGDAQGELSSKDGRLTLQLVDKVLFSFGEADLTDNGQSVLSNVGKALKDFPDKSVWIQGHTDNIPVSKDNERFASNWELSAARAVNVVHYLEKEVGVNPKRLAAVAFSQYRPVSKTQKGRNRRIEIMLVPSDISIAGESDKVPPPEEGDKVPPPEEGDKVPPPEEGDKVPPPEESDKAPATE